MRSRADQTMETRTAPPVRRADTARLVHVASAATFCVVSAYVAWSAPNLGLYDDQGPGPGFFPFGVGLLMLCCSLVWLAQLVRKRDSRVPSGFFESASGARRVILLVLGVVAMGLLVPFLGFQLGAFLFVLIFLTAYGRHHVLLSLVIAAAAGFGLFALFTQVLDLPLPVSSIAVLRDLGF